MNERTRTYVRPWILAIDYGRTSSKAASTSNDAPPSVLEVAGRPALPSAVLLDPDRSLKVGMAVADQEARWPERLERTPKRYIGTPGFVLGGVLVPTRVAAGELFRLLLEEGKQQHGDRAPARIVLTHPADWGGMRTADLREAATYAGIAGVELLREHVAVAAQFGADQIAPGGHMAIFDLGGETLKTMVLRRTADGVELAGPPGDDERPAGEAFDHLVYQYLGWCIGQHDEELWRQISDGDGPRWRQQRLDLLVVAQQAKEALSRWPRTQVHVPVTDRDYLLTREQFEDLIADEVERMIGDFERTIQAADLEPSRLAAIYLVGGSSRIPLVQRQMMQRFGELVTVSDDPQGVMALGAVKVALSRGSAWSQVTADLLTSETARRTVDRVQAAGGVARVRANGLAQTLRARSDEARQNLTRKADEFGIRSQGTDLGQVVDRAQTILDQTRTRLGGESRTERTTRKVLRDLDNRLRSTMAGHDGTRTKER